MDKSFLPEMSFAEVEDILDKVVLVDRKSTRLNSIHALSSYPVFCLTKKKN